MHKAGTQKKKKMLELSFRFSTAHQWGLVGKRATIKIKAPKLKESESIIGIGIRMKRKTIQQVASIF